MLAADEYLSESLLAGLFHIYFIFRQYYVTVCQLYKIQFQFHITSPDRLLPKRLRIQNYVTNDVRDSYN